MDSSYVSVYLGIICTVHAAFSVCVSLIVRACVVYTVYAAHVMQTIITSYYHVVYKILFSSAWNAVGLIYLFLLVHWWRNLRRDSIWWRVETLNCFELLAISTYQWHFKCNFCTTLIRNFSNHVHHLLPSLRNCSQAITKWHLQNQWNSRVVKKSRCVNKCVHNYM